LTGDRILLTSIFQKYIVKMWTGLSWLRLGSNDKLLWRLWWTPGFY
jgi:hypothetical protein